MASVGNVHRDEERFKHLLQPIRDLAHNWDVDIATSLEDYLEDLEEISITLDGGASKVNFAEAALLIQGSTCVYSRKVEHVYQLVLRTIEFLTQQKHAKDAKDTKGCSGNKGDEDITGGEMIFLPLDDVLEEGKHIDLEVLDQARKNTRRPSAGFGGDGDGYRNDVGDAHLSGGAGVPDISRPPMFLMEQDYGNSFKMSTCAVDQSGALLIEGSKVGSSNRQSSTFSKSGAATATSACSNGGVGRDKRACDFWGGLRLEGDEAVTESATWPEENGGGGFDGVDNDDDDDDDDDGGGGYLGEGFDTEGDLDEATNGDRAQPLAGVHTPNAMTSAAEVQRELRQQAPNALKADVVDPPTPVNPWAPLDAHDPGIIRDRPLRKGRTYRLPPQLRKARVSREGSGEYVDADDDKRAGGRSWVGLDGKLTTSLPLVGLAYPEFRYVLKRERQRKAAQGRLARRQAREFMGREEFLPGSWSAAMRASSHPRRETREIGGPGGIQPVEDDGDHPREVGGVDDFGSDGGQSGDSDEGGGDYFDYGHGDDDTDDEGDGFYGSGVGAEGGEDAGVAPISLEDAFRDKPQTYEDICRSHIEAFMLGTEKYAHETKLSKRVGAWQDKLEPLMRRQEKRQAFDIHVYGQTVLTTVSSVLSPGERARAVKAVKAVEDSEKVLHESTRSPAAGNEDGDAGLPLVDFGVVAGGQERFDVCRLFLASLQLANNGNVRLSHGDNVAEQGTIPFQLELLSLQNADNMSGYFAPSVSQSIDPNNAAGTGEENVGAISSKAKAKAKAKAKCRPRRPGGQVV